MFLPTVKRDAVESPRRPLRRPALEIRCVVRIAAARVMGVPRVGAERTGQSRLTAWCRDAARRDDGIRRSVPLDPVHQRREQVERIRCQGPAAAMAHARDEEQPAPALPRIGPAVRPGEPPTPLVAGRLPVDILNETIHSHVECQKKSSRARSI